MIHPLPNRLVAQTHRCPPSSPSRSLASLARVLDRLPAWLAGRHAGALVGPLRAHRFGHGDGESLQDGENGDSLALDDDESDVLAAYRDRARDVHERLVHDRGIFVAELLGATGSGKTRLLERLLDRASDEERIGVVVGDVAGEDDAARLRDHGATVTTVNTGKECHLDPTLVEDALDSFDLDALDRLYLENVGNMVCPADFPLGAQVRVLVVSTTEGDDVVRKHPLLFQACDAAVVNKTDIAGAVDADVDRMVADVAGVEPDLPVFRTSAKTGSGLDELSEYLADHRARGHEHDHHGTAHAHDGHAAPPDRGDRRQGDAANSDAGVDSRPERSGGQEASRRAGDAESIED
ncbi:MAG: hydrogenase nickel incorporation protein HypB [Haloarculaceae archaeon]